MPGEPLLVELDDGLRALDVGLPRRHQVRLVRPLPLDEEHELAGGVGGADDALRVEAAVEAARAVLLPGKLLALALLFLLLNLRTFNFSYILKGLPLKIWNLKVSQLWDNAQQSHQHFHTHEGTPIPLKIWTLPVSLTTVGTHCTIALKFS